MLYQKLFINRSALLALVVGLLGVVALTGFDLSRAAAAQDVTASALKPNGRIAYVYQDLYTINPDGTGQAKPVDPDTEVRYPAWSPDASKIAFSRNVFPVQNLDIFVANADGSNVVRLTNAGNAPTGTNTNYGVTWSPDGAKIAFTSTRSGNSDIWVMNADGSNPVNLTANSPLFDADPAWSPDGAKIAFGSQRDASSVTGDIGRGFDIYTMNADGSNVMRLTNNQVPDFSPSWSPLGNKIVFARRDINDQTGAQNSDIYTMNADGTSQTNITNHPSTDFDPSWSPDGTRIAFATYRDAFQNSNSEIYFMDADGSFPTRVTNSLGFEEREPDWGTVSANPTPTPTATPTPTPPPIIPVYSITGRVTDGAARATASPACISFSSPPRTARARCGPEPTAAINISTSATRASPSRPPRPATPSTRRTLVSSLPARSRATSRTPISRASRSPSPQLSRSARQPTPQAKARSPRLSPSHAAAVSARSPAAGSSAIAP